MKKTVVKGLIPLMAGAAVIGSGFSIWFFNNTTVSDNQNLKAEITQVAGVGQFKLSDAPTLVFDQTTDGRTAISVTSNAKAEGIHLEWAENANKVSNYLELGNENGEVHTGATQGTKQDDNELDWTTDDSVYYQMTVTINAGGLASYMDISYDGDAITKDAAKGTYTKTFDKNVWAFDWSKVTFAYAENMEPSDISEYTVLKNLVKAAGIVVNYKVEVLAA